MAGKKSDWVISLWVLVVFPLWWSDLLFLALFLVLFWLVLDGIILAPAIGLWPLDDGYVKHKFQQEETPVMPNDAPQKKKSFNWAIVTVIMLAVITVIWGFGLWSWWDENQRKSAVSVMSALLLLFVSATRLFPDQFKSECDRKLIFWVSLVCDGIILGLYIGRCIVDGMPSRLSWLSLGSLVVSIVMVVVSGCAREKHALAVGGLVAAFVFAVLPFVPIFL